MIIGNDLIAWIQEKSVRVKLPSSRQIELTPFGLLTYPSFRKEAASEEIQCYIADAIPFREKLESALDSRILEQYEEDSSEQLTKEIAQLWRIENIGISPPSGKDKEESVDLLNEFLKNLRILNSGHVEVAFPWNGNETRLTHNFQMAFVRLKSVYPTTNLRNPTESAHEEIRHNFGHRQRDVTRFLWIKNVQEPLTVNNLVTYRFTRIPFGIACSPFILAATIQFFLRKKKVTDAEKAERIEENLYVDNVLFTTNEENEILSLYKKSKAAFNGMKMNLTTQQQQESF
uniref:Reverse transcriptase domain-containing protein n=2 Tax=Caenorhabditis japonica TaxID=281687 RepID=A0A8R1ENR7_CAEJA